MNKGLSEKDYREYLIGLISSIFKILPLYEEKNEHLKDYIDSLVNFELYGIKSEIEELPYHIWYQKTLGTLRGIEKQLIELSDPSVPENHKRIRREILKTTGLIDKQIDQLKGE